MGKLTRIILLFILVSGGIIYLSATYSICPDGGKPIKSNDELTNWCEKENREGIKVKHGPWVAYYSERNLKERGEFTLGTPDRHWVFWYQNGNKKREGDLIFGKRHGRWSFWKENGEIDRVEHFLDGVPQDQP